MVFFLLLTLCDCSFSLSISRHLNGSDMSNTTFWLRVALGSAVVAVLGFAIYRAVARLKWLTSWKGFPPPAWCSIHQDQTSVTRCRTATAWTRQSPCHLTFFFLIPWRLPGHFPYLCHFHHLILFSTLKSVDHITPAASWWSYYSPCCRAQLFPPYIVRPG